MDHSSKYGVIEDNYLNLIKFISKQKHIDFKIKPNTANQINSAVSSNKIPAELISNSDSIHLIEWSDIVICVNSSIIFDAILNDKIFYYPKYFHDQEIIWKMIHVVSNLQKKSIYLTIFKILKRNTR